MNGIPIKAGHSHALLPNDVLQIADVIFKFFLRKKDFSDCPKDSAEIEDVEDSAEIEDIEIRENPAEFHTTMILDAIYSHPDKMMTVSQIHEWLHIHYPYYANKQSHNL